MQTFKTLFEAIVASEEQLCSSVEICSVDGSAVVFSSKTDHRHTYACIVDDGYQRVVDEEGKIKMILRKHNKVKGKAGKD